MIIKKHYVDTVTSGTTKPKNPRTARYLRKWRDPSTGTWRYEYAQGYKGGAGRRTKGTKRTWPPR